MYSAEDHAAILPLGGGERHRSRPCFRLTTVTLGRRNKSGGAQPTTRSDGRRASQCLRVSKAYPAIGKIHRCAKLNLEPLLLDRLTDRLQVCAVRLEVPESRQLSPKTGYHVRRDLEISHTFFCSEAKGQFMAANEHTELFTRRASELFAKAKAFDSGD